MKKLICLLMVLCLMVPVFSLAEDDNEEASVSDYYEDAEPEEPSEETEPLPAGGADPEDVIVDEETGETFYLTDAEQEKLDAYLEENPEEEDTGIDPDSLYLNPNLPDNVLNILLIGVDTRSKDPMEIVGLGDTQIIVSVNRDTGAIKMTSILRDSYVPLPGYKNSQKINCAFKWGCLKVKKGTNREKTRSGAAQAMRTINKNFEMNIENYVAINFNGLASIIDSLGGIEIELTKAEAKYINSYLKKHPPAYDNKQKGERVKLQEVAGVQLLDGVQAVMYARTRSISGQSDFNRTDRQRHLLELLMNKLLQNPDPLVLMDVVFTATEYADTNMNVDALVNLAFSVLPSLSGLMESGDGLFDQMRIPMDKQYKSTTINGQSVLKYNLKKHAQAIHEFIYNGNYYPAK